MTFDLIFIAVCLAIGSGFVLSYLLGRYHGLESAFRVPRRPQQPPRHRPTYLTAPDAIDPGDVRAALVLNELSHSGTHTTEA